MVAKTQKILFLCNFSRGFTKEQQIFNYRESHGRRAVENAFSILAQRFQVLATMQLLPEAVQDVVEECGLGFCLQNVIRERYPALQNAALDNEGQNLIPGEWRQQANARCRTRSWTQQ